MVRIEPLLKLFLDNISLQSDFSFIYDNVFFYLILPVFMAADF